MERLRCWFLDKVEPLEPLKTICARSCRRRRRRRRLSPDFFKRFTLSLELEIFEALSPVVYPPSSSLFILFSCFEVLSACHYLLPFKPLLCSYAICYHCWVWTSAQGHTLGQRTCSPVTVVYVCVPSRVPHNSP